MSDRHAAAATAKPKPAKTAVAAAAPRAPAAKTAASSKPSPAKTRTSAPKPTTKQTTTATTSSTVTRSVAATKPATKAKKTTTTTTTTASSTATRSVAATKPATKAKKTTTAAAAAAAKPATRTKKSPTTTAARQREPSPVRLSRPEVTDEFKALATLAFHAADKNGDGTIDESELGAVLRQLFPGINGAQINRIYLHVDLNRSGAITVDEFVIACAEYNFDLEQIVSGSEKQQQQQWKFEVPYSELRVERTIGEGTFGVVHVARWHSTRVAVKELKTGAADAKAVLEDFRNEVAVMSALRHPNVVLFMGATTTGSEKLCLVTEFIDGQSLHGLVHNPTVRFTLRFGLKIALEMAAGLAYLHTRKPAIIHRDLKPANVLIERGSNRVKLIDFGLSCVKPRQHELSDTVGSPLWMAPEILRGEPYSESVDQYSYALCIWELFTGQTPYTKFDFAGLVEAVGVQGHRPELPAQIPADVRELIESCWVSDPKARPPFVKIVESPVFASL